MKSVKWIVCSLLAGLMLLSGCHKESVPEATTEPTTTPATTAAPPTTVASTGVATYDSAEPEDAYNYVAIKRKADKITSNFDKIIRQNSFTGTVYMKLGNDFEYLNSKGYANSSAHVGNSINTCYYVGDITKQFTATAILRLCENKKLKLDDTIDKFFPKYKFGKQITVRHLLSMTSGIASYIDYADVVNHDYTLVDDLSKKITEEQSAQENKQAILKWIMSQNLLFNPGARFALSESNYYLLGEIIASVSGMSYEKYLTQEIFQPAGMTATGFQSNDLLAKPYHAGEKSQCLVYSGVGYSAFGMVSNVSDLLKWTEALLGRKIIGEASLLSMFDNNENGYGFGTRITNNRYASYGRVGAYGAKLMYSSDKSEIFVCFTNDGKADPSYIHSLFKRSIASYVK